MSLNQIIIKQCFRLCYTYNPNIKAFLLLSLSINFIFIYMGKLQGHNPLKQSHKINSLSNEPLSSQI